MHHTLVGQIGKDDDSHSPPPARDACPRVPGHLHQARRPAVSGDVQRLHPRPPSQFHLQPDKTVSRSRRPRVGGRRGGRLHSQPAGRIMTRTPLERHETQAARAWARAREPRGPDAAGAGRDDRDEQPARAEALTADAAPFQDRPGAPSLRPGAFFCAQLPQRRTRPGARVCRIQRLPGERTTAVTVRGAVAAAVPDACPHSGHRSGAAREGRTHGRAAA